QDYELVAGLAGHLSFLLSHERLASKVGLDIAQLQRTRGELDSARRAQQRFRPCRRPSIKGLDYYDECRPVGEVGGDFFDFVALDNSSLLVSIGDVSGKGVPAAIIMAGVQASLRALAVSYGPRITELMRDLNRNDLGAVP